MLTLSKQRQTAILKLLIMICSSFCALMAWFLDYYPWTISYHHFPYLNLNYV